jgi:hypothetical protein
MKQRLLGEGGGHGCGSDVGNAAQGDERTLLDGRKNIGHIVRV